MRERAYINSNLLLELIFKPDSFQNLRKNPSYVTAHLLCPRRVVNHMPKSS